MISLPAPRNSCSWGLAHTDTYRRASRALLKMKGNYKLGIPNFKGYGTNLQNPTKHICGIYSADAGKILLQTDQAGAEALIVAYLTRHGNFRDLFLNKIKSHVYVGLHLFAHIWQQEVASADVHWLCKQPVKELKNAKGFKEVEKRIKESDSWPPSKRYYFMAKQVCHSSNYGIKPPALRINVLQKSDGKVALTQKQAEEFLMIYHTLFPELREWHREIEAILNQTRTLYNLQGFPRTFFMPWGDDLFKAAYAFIPQSTVGCITAEAFCDMQDYIESEHLCGWDLLNDKHDSFLLQVPDDPEVVKHARKKMQEFMNRDLVSPRGERFKMRSSTSVGYNWQPYDETENPKGLQEMED